MSNLNLKKGKFPIIIKPNLGQPILLNLRDFKKDEDYISLVTFNALIVTHPDHNVQEILRQFHQNIYIQPILKEEGDFSERRSEKIPIRIIKINRISKVMLKECAQSGTLTDDHCIIWDIFNTLLEVEPFGGRKNLYSAVFQIREIKTLEKLIKKTGRNFLLLDIIHNIPNMSEEKINYHSLAIYDKDWKDFKFIHATDFHIARRNDFLSKFLKDKVMNKIKIYQERNKDLSKINAFILTRDFEFLEEFQDYRLKDLRYGRFNFNYNLRKLISFINKRVSENDLDFVLMTGDLVDYVDIARGNFQYKNNFHVFIDILLGINKGLDKPPDFREEEYINKKEIIAPIFTIVGNHDYRKGHYSLRLGNVNKIFGMTKKDLKGYYDLQFFSYLKALYSKDKFLRDYFRYINPNLNYRLQIGDEYNFIFLDTGQDSIADMHDLLKGGPSTKGLKDFQINLLRSYIKLSYNKKIIVVMHTPPVSPELGSYRLWRFRKKFKIKKRRLEWYDFYEHNLNKYTGSPRLEKILNLKYQTIMYNWNTLLKIFVGSDKIIQRKVDLILCGHTHTLKEFKLKEAKKKDAASINLGFFIAPIYINVPCEIYTNRYRDIFKSFKDRDELSAWYDVNKPFIFQTQAIGPISLKLKYKPPGFRYYTIEDNQIIYANIYSLHLKEKLEIKEQLKKLGTNVSPLTLWRAHKKY